MLVLVGEDQVVDVAVAKERIATVEVDLVEHLEGPLADLLEVGANLVGLEDRKLAADPSRLLDRVVEGAELVAQRLAPADPLYEPELLEVRDVAEVPDQRAQDR